MYLPNSLTVAYTREYNHEFWFKENFKTISVLEHSVFGNLYIAYTLRLCSFSTIIIITDCILKSCTHFCI